MTQPVGFSASLDYSPYEPEPDLCHAEGTGGATSSSRGADGAGGTPNAAPPPEETQNCTTELMKTVAACGTTILASKVLTPLAALGLVTCAANAAELVECLAEPEPKPQGP